jgi:hypothetical protein
MGFCKKLTKENNRVINPNPNQIRMLMQFIISGLKYFEIVFEIKVISQQ